MIIATNKRMDELINICSIDLDSIDLQRDLADIIKKGVVKIDDYYLLNDQAEDGFSPTEVVDQYFDRTDLECSINHIHINVCTTTNDLIYQGYKYAIELYNLLEKFGDFEIILSYSNDPIEDCSVRFHKIRLEETPYLLDLDTYLEDALLVIR